MINTSKAPPFWLITGLCIVASFALFLPVLGSSFFADDFLAVWRIGVLGELRQVSFFRPLSEFTLWINNIITGPVPAGYRAFNVLVHALNGSLIYLLVNRFPGLREHRHATTMALVAAVLFLAYPFHNESIVWVVGRGTSIATLFTLTGLVALNSGMSERRKLTLVPLCCFLGALAYESMLLFPLIITPMLLRGCAEQRPFRQRMAWAMIGTIALHFVLRWAFTRQVTNAYGGAFFDRPWATYPMNAAKVLGRLLLPPVADEHTQLLRFALLLTLLAVTAFVFWRRYWSDRPIRVAAVDLLWMLGVSCVVAVVASVSTRTSESDRFLYMPSAFLCILMALVLFTLVDGMLRWAMVALLLIGSCILLQVNNAHWATASVTIGRIVKELPAPPDNGRLFVSGLPQENNGAFIFRHGFHEGLLLAGRDTARIVRADTILWGVANPRGTPTLSNENRQDTLFLRTSDQLAVWTSHGFAVGGSRPTVPR
ncbi:MAG: hypothetical protein ABI432_12030 [Flavobacteriales bacterium]